MDSEELKIPGYREKLLYQDKTINELTALSPQFIGKVRYNAYEQFNKDNPLLLNKNPSQWAAECNIFVQQTSEEYEMKARDLIFKKDETGLEKLIKEVEDQLSKFAKLSLPRKKAREDYNKQMNLIMEQSMLLKANNPQNLPLLEHTPRETIQAKETATSDV